MDRRRFARMGLCGMAAAVLRARVARSETAASTSFKRFGRVLLTMHDHSCRCPAITIVNSLADRASSRWPRCCSYRRSA